MSRPASRTLADASAGFPRRPFAPVRTSLPSLDPNRWRAFRRGGVCPSIPFGKDSLHEANHHTVGGGGLAVEPAGMLLPLATRLRQRLQPLQHRLRRRLRAGLRAAGYASIV